MVKPPPTRTTSKAPVSLSPVKALSSAPAMAKSEPAVVAVPKPAPAFAPVAVKPAAPVAAPAQPVAPVAKANPAAPAAPAKAAPPSAPLPGPAAVKPSAKAPVKVASTKQRIEKPVTKVVAPKAPMEAAPAAKPVATAPAAPQPVAAKPVEIKPAEVKPAEPPKPVAKVETVAAAPAPAAKPATTPAPAPAPAPKAPETPVSLDSLPLPRPPEFAKVTTETVMSQALTMARAFGALQAKMLEHACSELKATLGDAETLARSDSASEAVALQAKAVRRSYESYAEHLKELARIANTALRKD